MVRQASIKHHSSDTPLRLKKKSAVKTGLDEEIPVFMVNETKEEGDLEDRYIDKELSGMKQPEKLMIKIA